MVWFQGLPWWWWGPVGKTPCFQCRGQAFPSLAQEDPKCCGAKKENDMIQWHFKTTSFRGLPLKWPLSHCLLPGPSSMVWHVPKALKSLVSSTIPEKEARNLGKYPILYLSTRIIKMFLEHAFVARKKVCFQSDPGQFERIKEPVERSSHWASCDSLGTRKKAVALCRATWAMLGDRKGGGGKACARF